MLGESEKSTNDGGVREGGEEDVVESVVVGADGSACWQLCCPGSD